MFVDACAIVAMMAGEETAEAYETALVKTNAPFTSPLAAWEAIIVLSRPDQLDCRYREAEGAVVEWLDARSIEIREAGSPRQLLGYAVAIAEKHGIGRRYLSNFDCFHYAYAKVTEQPLLTLDQLLRQTDADTRP
ncbi:Probable ribonuclease VapC 5 [Neorhizobium galegae bv. orientalis]|nr:Probable ribonuclease VapC 5 [Neorhizobium galegae bv. orientalis]